MGIPMLQVVLGTLGAIVAALLTAVATYAVARRQNSGSATTSDAVTLWNESQAMRAELRQEVISLRTELASIRTENTALIIEVRELRKENTRLGQQVDVLQEEVRRLRREVSQASAIIRGKVVKLRPAEEEGGGDDD